MHSNLSLFKHKQTLLLKSNESSFKNLFDQLNPINNKISFTSLAFFFESLNILPNLLSLSKLGKYVETICHSQTPESTLISFSQFKTLLKTIATRLFSLSSNTPNSFESFIKHIKSPCKSKFNVEIVEKCRENIVPLTSMSNKKIRFMSSSISKGNLKSHLDEITQEISEKRAKNTSSVIDLKKIRVRVLPKFANYYEKSCLQFFMNKDQNKSDRSLHIAPVSYPKTARYIGKTEKIKEKFKNFKRSMGDLIRKKGKICMKKGGNDDKFVVKNRRKLVSNCFVAKIVFFAWKSHVFNRKKG
ncbi:hypothetical protein SteCoe_29566 [Stentor coeruleus]|uniref:Uncharacterized protein n=1 Tax=Stentor coeruleus TaxID=5963 RepID=A0A1R2B5Y9_9CILI|nr:hypothetical protein SteCoe_29566 [Stentor coeruleus]